jgi:hypothetical protein
MTTDGPDLFDHAAGASAPVDTYQEANGSAFLVFILQNQEDDLDATTFGKPFDYWVGFEDWRHTDAGREIANLFLRLALQMRRRGWDHFGAQDIVGRIRWEHALKHGPDGTGHKVRSRWKRPLAIWAMWRHAELKGFFRTKGTRGQDGDE